MGSHPINLVFRLVLELGALVALGAWGWHLGEGVLRYLLAAAIPAVAAVLWGTFAVPDDPSRSGKAPVPVSGMLRLALEIGIFALATWSLFDVGAVLWAWILGIAVLVHYAISYDRFGWLLKH